MLLEKSILQRQTQSIIMFNLNPLAHDLEVEEVVGSNLFSLYCKCDFVLVKNMVIVILFIDLFSH